MATRHDSTNATRVTTPADRMPATVELKPKTALVTTATTAIAAVTDANTKAALTALLNLIKG